MQISLETHGGLAAGMRRPPQHLETEALDEQSARELARLVAGALAEASPSADSAPVPDGMSYTVSIHDGVASHVLRQSDGSMGPHFAELLDWLVLHFSARRP